MLVQTLMFVLNEEESCVGVENGSLTAGYRCSSVEMCVEKSWFFIMFKCIYVIIM